MGKTVISIENIKRNFQVGDETVHARSTKDPVRRRRRERHRKVYVTEHTGLPGYPHQR